MSERTYRMPVDILREAIKKSGLKRWQIAEAIGVSQPTIRNWLRGEPAYSTNIEQLAHVLKIDAKILKGGGSTAQVSPPSDEHVDLALDSLHRLFDNLMAEQTKSNTGDEMQEYVFKKSVSGISFHLRISLNDRDARAKLAKFIKMAMSIIGAVAPIIVRTIQQGSIILVVSMEEEDAISLAHAFADGRLDDLDLLRIDFMELTPKLKAAIAEIREGETSVSWMGWRRKVSLVRGVEQPVIDLSVGEDFERRASMIFGRITRQALTQLERMKPKEVDAPPQEPLMPHHLVNLFVRWAVIAVLIIMLVPAIQAAREAARRAQCVNNLKQLGLAMHNYHSSNEAFPPGASASNNPYNPGCIAWMGWSTHALMFNYIEQSGVYNDINFSIDPVQSNGGNGANTTVRGVVVTTFLCPSDNNAGKSFINSYYASMGTTTFSSATVDNVACNGGNQGSSGLFAYATSYGIRDATDGSSNTVAFSEGLVGEPAANIRTPRVTGVNINSGLAVYDASADPTQLLATLQSCDTAFSTAKPGAGLSVNRGWLWGWGSDTMTMFNTIVPPSSTQHEWGQCRFGCVGCGPYSADHSNITNANSNHPGGANVLMGDGSVRFIKSTLSPNTWWAIGTKAGGEVIFSDSY